MRISRFILGMQSFGWVETAPGAQNPALPTWIKEDTKETQQNIVSMVELCPAIAFLHAHKTHEPCACHQRNREEAQNTLCGGTGGAGYGLTCARSRRDSWLPWALPGRGFAPCAETGLSHKRHWRRPPTPTLR